MAAWDPSHACSSTSRPSGGSAAAGPGPGLAEAEAGCCLTVVLVVVPSLLLWLLLLWPLLRLRLPLRPRLLPWRKGAGAAQRRGKSQGQSGAGGVAATCGRL